MREHGTRAKYVLDHCHCGPCTEANRVYARMRDRASRRPDEGLEPAYVDAAEAVAHVRWLATQGVGTRQVCDQAGVARSAVLKLLNGDRTRARRTTIDKLLAVSTLDRAGGALVAAGPTWKLLDELIAHGHTRGSIAAQLGSKAKTPALQLRHDYVTQRSADAVAALHARLMLPILLDRAEAAERKRQERLRSLAPSD